MSKTQTSDNQERATGPGGFSNAGLANPVTGGAGGAEAGERPARLRPPGSTTRLWGATTLTAAVATPLAWLLSYAATLPFFLGVFFFALFGLIIGAFVYRFARRHRPYRKGAVVTATTLLVGFVFVFALVKESRDLPRDLANVAAKKTADLGGRSGAEFRAEVAELVRQHLRRSFPPGGTIGYVRWVLAGGKLARGELTLVDAELTAPQTRLWWAVRVVLSLALLAFGIGSQTFTLWRRGHEPRSTAVAPGASS